MKEQQRLDKILDAVQIRIQEEVGGLLAAEFSLSEFSNQLLSKEEVFDQPIGKQVMAKMDITGELEGKGCLLVSLKDAIRLGGTLIMLPDSELEEVVGREEYREETEDSYGEIANIIAGSYTKTFEEMHKNKFRFVRKNQEILVPVKVDIDSDEPVPNQKYYQVSAAMSVKGVQMGNLLVLLPAATFGLQEEPGQEQAAPPPPKPAKVVQAPDSEKKETRPVAEEGEPEEEEATVETGPAFDVDRHKKRVDTLLESVRKQVGEEVGALLGVEIKLLNHECRFVSKEDFFFDEATGKQVLANMDIVGEIEGNSYLFVSLKDAIFIGGSLIMLPPSELEIAVSDEEFGPDAEDAYGEIANIISGVYTAIFEEQYTQKIRFVKTGLEQVVPMKVETESAIPMPNQRYYMSSSVISFGEKPLGKMQMLIPANLLQLESWGEREAVAGAEAVQPIISGKKIQAGGEAASKGPGGEESLASADEIDILLVSDDTEEAEKIVAILAAQGLGCRMLSFKESVASYLPGQVKAIFLVMHEVTEQAFGVAIKISGVSRVPLIAAGPAWTRSKVIKAVKYGVEDILLTPAEAADVEEKIKNLSIAMAA